MGTVSAYMALIFGLGVVGALVVVPRLRKLLWADVKNLGLHIWDLADVVNDWPTDIVRAYRWRPRHSFSGPGSRAWSMTL